MKKILLFLLLITVTATHAGPGLLQNLGLSDDATPLDVDEAFAFSAELKDPTTLIAKWDIAQGNYLYRDKIHFQILDNNKVNLQPVQLPAGENKVDEIFGLSEVYHYDTDVQLKLDRPAAAQNVTLKVNYQGCSESFSICYPPTEKFISLTLPAVSANNLIQDSDPAEVVAEFTTLSEQDRLARQLAEDSLLQILLSFFGLGVLLAFTPCVFPMIPILSSIIVGEGERITTHRAFILSLVYVLAMSVTYTTAGVLTGLLGENLQTMLQNPWVISSFSALFVILALSMFGLFELQLPHALQHRLHQLSHRQQGGTLIGVALMGLLSGLIVGPCLAPPLAGALIFIGQHADPLLGGSALFALSMGMGLPLLIIGTSAGSLLPKAGDWMNTIKSVFGVLMLSLAIWMLARIVPDWVTLILWGGLFIVTAVYMGALNSLDIDATGWQKLWKGIGLVLLIYGGLLVVGGASGGHNPLQPLQAFAAARSTSSSNSGLTFTRINSLAELQQQLNNSSQPVMLDFYADWCTDCKTMEATTFKDTAVVNALATTRLLQLDMTDNTRQHQALLKALQVFGPPSILFFDVNGNEYRQQRLVGHISATALLQHLQRLPATAH